MTSVTQIILTTSFGFTPEAVTRELHSLTDNIDWAYSAHLEGITSDNIFENYVPVNTLIQEHPDIIPFRGNEVAFKKILTRLNLDRESSFIRYRNYFAAPEIPVTGHNGHIFGLETAASDAESQRRMAENSTYVKLWQELLSTPDLASVSQHAPFHMLQNAMSKLFALMNDQWNESSLFYDTLSGSTNPLLALDALSGKVPATGYNDYGGVEDMLVMIAVKLRLN